MRVRLTVLCFITIVLFISVCSGQSPTGTVSGIILDPSGAAIAGADVLIINDATAVQYPGKTNSEGYYVVSNIPPGTYRIQVSNSGFKTVIKPDIVVHVEDALAINFTLPIGSASEVVTVEGGASMINTTDASVSTVVDRKYVENMPLNGRSFQDLILLTPGVVTQSPQNTGALLGQTGEFSVNGQRAESNVYSVDGVSANLGVTAGVNMIAGAGASGSVPAATALGTTQALVPVDDLQEFRVQSSTYSAQYGRNPGGQFALETRSGTNQWHGTVFDYVRNAVFDANDWFNDYFNVKEPALQQNDFGGTIGGPVHVPGVYNGKDKTFFFVSYEGLRLTQPQAATVNYVPDAALRSSTPQPLQQVLNAFPVGNGSDDTVNGVAQFIASWSNPSSLDSTSVRLDHVVNNKLRLFFRFSDTPSNSRSRGSGLVATPTELNSSEYISRTYTTGVDTAFSNRFSNQFRLNYSTNHVKSAEVIDQFGGGTPVDLAQLQGVDAGAGLSLVFIYSGYELGISQLQEFATQRQWNLVDSVGISIGRHQLKFGVDYRRLTPTATPIDPSVEYLYLSQDSIQANLAFGAISQSLAPAHPLYQNFSAFVQDEWKATPRLGLSLGLRWEVDPAPGVTQGIKPYTIEGSSPSTYTLAPEGTPLWKTSWGNVAPRLGAAYVLRDRPSFETVIRGGAGVFYDTGQQLGSTGFQGPGYSSGEAIQLSVPFPLPASDVAVPIVNPPVPPYRQVWAFPSGLELPYAVQWNGSIEQAFGNSQVVTVSYVGSHGARLLEQSEISGSTVNNANIGTLYLVRNGLTSDYNALQIQFQRRLSRGLTALASYTWSHCIDYGSQNYNFPFQRGDCDFDVRHNVSAAFSYDVPNVGQTGFLQAVLNHWGLDDRFTARTGFPVTLLGNPNIDLGTGQTYYSGLNLVAGQAIYIYGAQCAALYNNGHGCPGGRAVNPNAFRAPASGLGNAPRNFVRGFGAWQMDLAVRRDFPIYERLKLQFRAEAFNIFNHPNFGKINATFCSPTSTSPEFATGCTFGQAIGTLASNLGILSPLYQQGGPRSMQFALKLVF